MVATNRVYNSDGKTVGFIIADEGFYNIREVQKYIDRIDNLKVVKTKKGISIHATSALPIKYYNTCVTKAEYANLCKQMPFTRDVEKSILKWYKGSKGRGKRQILQIKGARQIGKTSEIKKFAYRHYEYVIYVNLADDVYNFVETVVRNKSSRPVDMTIYCENANLPPYVNSDKTVLILDEIQENTEVFNALRRLQEKLNCDIVITGSYLGRYSKMMNNPDTPFFSAGNIHNITMQNLSFREFCRVFKAEELLMHIDIFGCADDESYGKLLYLYDLYRKIGGYPAVVLGYLSRNAELFPKTPDLSLCYMLIEQLLNTFKEESRRYFSNIKQVELFDNIYRYSVVEMLTEKRGTGKNLLQDILNTVPKTTNQLVNKQDIEQALYWLLSCNILDSCSMLTEGNKQVDGRRIYFTDCGILSYVLSHLSLPESDKSGLITETFAFNELKRLYNEEDLRVYDNLCFGVYNNYELDFVVTAKDYTKYGIEVKTTKADHNSLDVYLNKHFIDKGVIARRTKGGTSGNYITIPVFAVGVRFPYTNNRG